MATEPSPPPKDEQISAVESPQREKLFGRKFYESIGSPKYVVAPMVDRSEFVSTLAKLGRDAGLTIVKGVAHAHSILHAPE